MLQGWKFCFRIYSLKDVYMQTRARCLGNGGALRSREITGEQTLSWNLRKEEGQVIWVRLVDTGTLHPEF